MESADVASALNEFLHRFLDDRERGRVEPLGVYQASFPSAADAIATEYARLIAARDTNPEGAGAVEAKAETIGSGSTVGPYRLPRRLGRGSFGLVYLAEDTRLVRQVALKILAHSGLESPRELAMFQREAEIASRLDHPGICTVFEIGREGIWTFIAMRYVAGETLSAVLARSRETGDRTPPDLVAATIEQVARALHTAHEAGVIHRDVKPDNIMITPGGEPVVLDFGLARERASGPTMLTATGEVIGTPAYMSPEQIDRAAGGVDHRTDIWSLGVTLYECLTLERPFDAATQGALFHSILHADPPPVRKLRAEVSRDLSVVVETALTKEPASRYQSALDLAEDLRRARSREPILARPVGLSGRLLRWTRRNPLPAALVTAVFLALAAGLAVSAVLLSRAETSLRDWERLADGRRLDDLATAANDELWPAVPEKVPEMERWLAVARGLTSRLPDHEQGLARLRERAKPPSDATRVDDRRKHAAAIQELAATEAKIAYLRDRVQALHADPISPESREVERRGMTNEIERDLVRKANIEKAISERLSFEFDDPRDQLQHDKLTDLVLRLRVLAGLPGPPGPTVYDMETRVAFARALYQSTIADHAPEWRNAIARVAANPRYQALVLPEQVGLIPLGPDPASSFEEFCETSTGTIPKRDSNGGIVVTQESALVFVLLPGGTFMMGAQHADPNGANYDPAARGEEGPPHEVDVAPFFLSKYEMTQGQWFRGAGENRSGFARGQRFGDTVVDLRHPAESISRYDCAYVLRHLGLMLPTEAQWEHGCRGGTSGAWWCRSEEKSQCMNVADRAYVRTHEATGWAYDDVDDGYSIHAPVGMFRPNAFGLHDVHGNVAEWCADEYYRYDGARSSGDIPNAAPSSRIGVNRGGSWAYGSFFARSSARSSSDSTIRQATVGVRPARPLVRP